MMECEGAEQCSYTKTRLTCLGVGGDFLYSPMFCRRVKGGAT